jgi:hypothetical protein
MVPLRAPFIPVTPFIAKLLFTVRLFEVVGEVDEVEVDDVDDVDDDVDDNEGGEVTAVIVVAIRPCPRPAGRRVVE